MRKLNAIITASIMLIFVLHAVTGSLNMMNIAPIITRVEAYVMLGLICVHTVLGAVLTVKSVKVWKDTGAPYFRENINFWTRRLSGLVIMILIVFHITAFSSNTAGAVTLPYFGVFRLVTQLLLVLSIAVHVITNVKPMLISFGIKKLRPRVGDILFFISAVLLVAVVAFIIYFIRWNTI
ncbi:MAG: hypothetical protein IJ725_01030 [Ruminococcus sp.]|nr:hypothetical protein [Ruminococcus sp.]